MKKILLTLALLAAVTVHAQYGITVDTNCVIKRGTNFFTANSNLWMSPMIGWIHDQQYISALQTNVVMSSHRYTIFSTNAFVMSGSNYIGRFPQLFDWTLMAPSVEIPGSMGLTTLLPEALWGSYDGTNGWFPLPDNFVCWSNISLSVVGTNTTGIGGVTIYGLDHPELYGNVISFDGQTWLANGKKVATQDDISQAVHALTPPVQMAGAWVLDSQATNGETVTWYNHNMAIFTMTGYAAGIPMANGGLDGTHTNLLIMTPVTNLVTGWLLETCTNLNAPVIWQTALGYTMTTNTGVVTFTAPMNFALQCQFFRLRNAATQSASFSIPVAMPALLLTPGTITNSTDPAAGAGLVCIDTNFVYVSVGTNRWKRASLSSW
ncbi:MAG: hypothetical protein ABSF60_08980 [Verrucomicrobiota bacterium]